MVSTPEKIDTDIVCFSHDLRLVETRRMVFEAASFVTTVVETVSALDDVLREGPVGVVVLCHSLSSAECKLAEELIERLYPRTGVLQLKSQFSPYTPLKVGEKYDSQRGPEGLLTMVN